MIDPFGFTNVETFKELATIAKMGPCVAWAEFGNVRAVYRGDLLLLNYTAKAQYDGRWNWLERVSRGLILNWRTGEIVARPFNRFWNWGERGRTSEADIATITEKIDGSLGILYRDNGYKIATRGSFDGEQAVWATEHLAKYDLTGLPDEYTLLFEIVYPENRIVVDYGNVRDLFLLAVRNRHTGGYLSFAQVCDLALKYHFPVPRIWHFDDTAGIIAAASELDLSQEGWVVEFADDQRFKFKGDRYREVHRLVTQATFRRVLQSVAEGTYDELLEAIPDELLDQIREWREEIAEKAAEIERDVAFVMSKAPKDDRKKFACYITSQFPILAPYCFMALDGRDVRALIYKRAFKNRGQDDNLVHSRSTFRA